MRHLRRPAPPPAPVERTWRCDSCKGKLSLPKGTRATTEAVTRVTEVHAETCPGTYRVVRK